MSHGADLRIANIPLGTLMKLTDIVEISNARGMPHPFPSLEQLDLSWSEEVRPGFPLPPELCSAPKLRVRSSHLLFMTKSCFKVAED